jgi:hypothetical protein
LFHDVVGRHSLPRFRFSDGQCQCDEPGGADADDGNRGQERALLESIHDATYPLSGFSGYLENEIVAGRIYERLTTRPTTVSLPRRKPPASKSWISSVVSGRPRCRRLGCTLFWTAADLERKLLDFQRYYNGHRAHAGL